MPAFILTATRHWKLIGLGLLVLALSIQTVRLSAAHNQIERRDFRINELKAELESISTKRNEQREETGRNIKDAEKVEREAAPIVKIIREAPIPPDCKTPGLDVLRNEI